MNLPGEQTRGDKEAVMLLQKVLKNYELNERFLSCIVRFWQFAIQLIELHAIRPSHLTTI